MLSAVFASHLLAVTIGFFRKIIARGELTTSMYRAKLSSVEFAACHDIRCDLCVPVIQNSHIWGVEQDLNSRRLRADQNYHFQKPVPDMKSLLLI